MEHNRNRIALEAATDEPASSFNPSPAEAPPGFAEPPLLSDALGAAMAEALDESFPEGGRKPRHDGWTPEAVAGFLRHLAATGVIEHAARAVGLSATSAYAFRNRRQGRAFARMWDAVLVHRARARIASELQARAVAGCVSVRKRDGAVVGEYHYYDNRLAMAMLTRLDRLAEGSAEGDAQLRALSEDLDGFIDCLAEGGDADAFVDARRPAQEAEAAAAAELQPDPVPPDDNPEITTFARLAGCSDYRDVDPRTIDMLDLDPTAKAEWGPDQWVRASRSGFLSWLLCLEKEAPDAPLRPGAPFCFHVSRAAALAAVECGMPAQAEDAAPIDTADLDTGTIWDWTEDQLARAWRSGLLARLPAQFWDDLADAELSGGDEE